ncbi:MAG: G8 domain-containing protein [Planctomycetes bacterium]|nr:G8 domain-containing protein [Planctomycetota bacterium]
MRLTAVILIALSAIALRSIGQDNSTTLIRSAKNGPWSQADTWEGGQVPGEGARVQIRVGHSVLYDARADAVIRSIHVAGTLSFAHDRDTILNVGLIKIQAGDDASENGFDCDAAHLDDMDAALPRPALEVGRPDRPIATGRTASIRLHAITGTSKESWPAIVCCGGRMDFHGAPMSRTWIKLGADANKGDATVTLAEEVSGWKSGDRVIVTATQGERGTEGTRRPGTGDVQVQTEERTIKKIDGGRVVLDKPLAYTHKGTGEFRGAVANLSRNVVIESADPNKARGHTMYHRGSAGAISFAEFRYLGKEGVLGRYSIHFHLCGNTMRGSYVLGASIWDSGNRWLTIHGTNYLVVRDCVGYRSVGHGFFLEDGTETHNVLDRNLAVQAFAGKPLPKQALPFDENNGAGFWWANSLNTFTRNVSCENDRYGFRFEATKTSAFKLHLPIVQPDGNREIIDIRTLPFIRFEDNEAHCDGRYGFNLGEGVARIGPDRRHPFIIRNMKIWEVHYAFRPQSPSVLVENMQIHRCDYGVYHPNYDNHVYRNLTISETNSEPFNRGHDDDSVQYGSLTVDGLTFSDLRDNPIPMIQISDDNPLGAAETHIRNLRVVARKDNGKRALVNLGGGSRPTPKTPTCVPVYLHDYFGPGRTAKVLSVKSKDLGHDGLEYTSQPPLTGDASRVAETKDVDFPKLLDPVYDLPPATVITHIRRGGDKLIVRGTAMGSATLTKVSVNGKSVTPLSSNFAEWEATVPANGDVIRLEAHAEDATGNVERTPHKVKWRND